MHRNSLNAAIYVTKNATIILNRLHITHEFYCKTNKDSDHPYILIKSAKLIILSYLSFPLKSHRSFIMYEAGSIGATIDSHCSSII